MQRSEQPVRWRLSVIALFFLVGQALAMWIVNIPAIQQRLELSNATLGLLLLFLGAGAVAGMQGTGPFVDRIGSRRTAMVGVAVLAVAVNLPGVASAPWQLGAALFLLGLGNGITNVSMNDQAVHAERAWGRPIMSSFHAFFSIGGAFGAGVGALTQAAHLPPPVSLGFGCAVVVILGVVAVSGIPAAAPVHQPAETAAMTSTASSRAGRVVALGGAAFLLMLAEGTANDWSALQAIDRLGVDAAAGSIAYGAFAAAMTLGRFGTDPVVHRLGAVRVMFFGALIAAVGMAAVMSSTTYPVTLIGWAVFGLGLAGIAPQIFTAAGNLGMRNQGVVLAAIVGAGYVGLLAGPAIVGALSQLVGLSVALIVPLLCCIAGLALAPAVRPTPGMTAPAARTVTGAAARSKS